MCNVHYKTVACLLETILSNCFHSAAGVGFGSGTADGDFSGTDEVVGIDDENKLSCLEKGKGNIRDGRGKLLMIGDTWDKNGKLKSSLWSGIGTSSGCLSGKNESGTLVSEVSAKTLLT